MKFIIASIIALFVFLLTRIIRLGHKRQAALYSGWNFKINFLAAFELIIWSAYVFWSTNYLFSQEFYFHSLVYGFIFILVGFLAWFLIRDMIAGIVFKLLYNLKPGIHIKVGDYSGTIKSEHATFIIIRTDDGQLLRIPFSKINNEVILEGTHSKSNKEYLLRLHIDASFDKKEAELYINEIIQNSPWSNLKEEPVIKFIEEDESGTVYEIMLFSMNPKRIHNLVSTFIKSPSVKVVS